MNNGKNLEIEIRNSQDSEGIHLTKRGQINGGRIGDKEYGQSMKKLTNLEEALNIES